MFFKMVYSIPKNEKSRVCQSQVYYLHTTHSLALKTFRVCSSLLGFPPSIPSFLVLFFSSWFPPSFPSFFLFYSPLFCPSIPSFSSSSLPDFPLPFPVFSSSFLLLYFPLPFPVFFSSSPLLDFSLPFPVFPPLHLLFPPSIPSFFLLFVSSWFFSSIPSFFLLLLIFAHVVVHDTVYPRYTPWSFSSMNQVKVVNLENKRWDFLVCPSSMVS